jgi:hypothetical protein
MKKSALIFGLVSFLTIIGGGLFISPLCTPCIATFVGAIAGYLAGVFDKPLEKSAAVKGGALAGLLAGIGAILGQIMGAVINGVTVGPEGVADLMRRFGVNTGGADLTLTYWLTLVVSTICFGLLNIALMAGTGALGGLVWNSMNNKQTPLPPVTGVQ